MSFLTQGKTNWKFIAIVVALAIIVGGGILWCQKPSEQLYPLPEIEEPKKLAEDETADWQTYRDELNRYEIKYPEGAIPKRVSPHTRSRQEYVVIVEVTPLDIMTDIWHKSFEIIMWRDYEECSMKPLEEALGLEFEEGGSLNIGDVVFNEAIAKLGPDSYIIDSSNYYTKIGEHCIILRHYIVPLEGSPTPLPYFDREEENRVFNQMLSTFRFIEIKKEELEKKETIQIIEGLVKGGEEFCKERNLPYKEALTINLGPGGGDAVFVSCFSLGSGAAYVLEQTNNEWEIIWIAEKAAGKMVRAPEVVDVESNGINQIYWLKGDAGGTCTCYSSEASIYYIRQKQEFSLYRGGCFDAQCEYIIEKPFKFSENLQEAKYPSKEWNIKKYLLEKDAEKAKMYANLSSGVGIAFPNGGEALILGETYYVSVVTTLSEEEYIYKTGEIGVALWKGEERLGFILNRFSEFFFEWKAGEYRTTKGKKETASPGKDYRIQLYSVSGLEDFSDRNFALIEDEE